MKCLALLPLILSLASAQFVFFGNQAKKSIIEIVMTKAMKIFKANNSLKYPTYKKIYW